MPNGERSKAELELLGERRHRDYLENAVYELSHWKDLEQNRAD